MMEIRSSNFHRRLFQSGQWLLLIPYQFNSCCACCVRYFRSHSQSGPKVILNGVRSAVSSFWEAPRRTTSKRTTLQVKLMHPTAATTIGGSPSTSINVSHHHFQPSQTHQSQYGQVNQPISTSTEQIQQSHLHHQHHNHNHHQLVSAIIYNKIIFN